MLGTEVEWHVPHHVAESDIQIDQTLLMRSGIECTEYASKRLSGKSIKELCETFIGKRQRERTSHFSGLLSIEGGLTSMITETCVTFFISMKCLVCRPDNSHQTGLRYFTIAQYMNDPLYSATFLFLCL